MDCTFDPTLVLASRLAIVACLAHGEPMSFMTLRRHTSLADGNLHVQAARLVAAGLLTTWKETGKRRRTWFQITPEGRRRLRELITRLELSLEQPPAASSPPAPTRRNDDARVW